MQSIKSPPPPPPPLPTLSNFSSNTIIYIYMPIIYNRDHDLLCCSKHVCKIAHRTRCFCAKIILPYFFFKIIIAHYNYYYYYGYSRINEYAAEYGQLILIRFANICQKSHDRIKRQVEAYIFLRENSYV